MVSSLRTRAPKRRRAGSRVPSLDDFIPIEERPRAEHDYGGGLPIPDPITFIIGEQWLNRTLYPKQATLIKIIFLRDDLFTDYDFEVIAKWEQAWRDTQGTDANNGTPPRLLERIEWMKKERIAQRAKFGHFDSNGWFREVILVLGRRAGKGYVFALCFAYVLYRYMACYNPQEKYGVDRDKQFMCLIYAGRKEQARDNLWRDIVNVITGAPVFKKYISSALGESLSIMSPADLDKRKEAIGRGEDLSGIDRASFKIIPLPATPMSGRGGASFSIGMDEMGHMIATGANRAAEEVWKAATPSLRQFSIDAFIMCPSSPWEMVGQLYIEWQQAQEIDPETKFYVYPEKFVLQLASWETYDDWDRAHTMDLFPTDAKFIGDLKEYANRDYPKLKQLYRPVLGFDAEMERLERSDPEGFAVEYRSFWQATVDAFLDPKKIAEMFAPLEGPNGEEIKLQMVTRGALGTYYKGHADPGFVNDNFGLAVAHTATDADGYMHVVFDYLHQWEPHTFPDHTVDYIEVTEALWELIKGFPIDDFSFDQHQSMGFFAELNARARKHNLPKMPQIHIINEMATYNLKVAQTFKVALNQGWIHAPEYEAAELQLKFLQFKNGKVTHQTAGPVQHDDVARAMFEVTFALLERQVSTFLMEGVSLSASLAGGHTPWMHPMSGQEKEAVDGLRAAGRMPRTGTPGGYSPARGKPGYVGGRGPMPRTPSRRGWGR